MSTILEALRRIEREHSQPGQGRSLREAVAAGAAAERPPASASWRAPLVTLVLGVGLGAGILLLWGNNPEPAVREAAKPALAPPQREPAHATAREIAPPVAVPVAREPLPDVAVLERPPASPRSVIEWSTGGATPAPAAASGPPGSGRVSPALAPPAATAASPEPPPAARPQPASPAPVASPVASVKPAEPALSVRVKRTFWHPRAERRLAIVELPGEGEFLRVREGEQLDGFMVTRIEPSRVVFEREGAEVVRPLEGR